MIFSSLPASVGVLTLGTVGLVFVSAVAVLFYCTRPRREEREEEAKFEGIECEHEHRWTTKATTEQGATSQRTAYYGTLSLSAQNSPARHLRSVSATNPPTHFLSPSHVRSPRRNSSPTSPHHVVGSSRSLSPHTHVIDLTGPLPVQPPYWDPERQQYFHSFSYDSTHASPRRKFSSRSPSRSPPSSLATTNMPPTGMSSPAAHKSSRSPPQPVNPLTAQLVQEAVTPKKLSDYSNLYLPQAPQVKSKLVESGDAPTEGINRETATETRAEREEEDVLEVTADKEEHLQVIMNITDVPRTRKSPEDEDHETGRIDRQADEQEKKMKVEEVLSEETREDCVAQGVNDNIVAEKEELLIKLTPGSTHGEKKHVSEVN